MSPPLLLDTCALIWTYEDNLSEQGAQALAEAARTGAAIVASPISAWEIGMLVAKRRLAWTFDPEQWFGRATGNFGIGLAPLLPRVLIASSFLPGKPPKDPADRVIIATARDVGAAVLTRDRRILDYAEEGYLQALAC